MTFEDSYIYDETKWTLDTSKVSKCETARVKKGGQWDSSYEMCMMSKLPSSITATFEVIPEVKPLQINWNKAVFDKIEPIDDLMAAYRAPCKGDSGTGQMFLAHDNFDVRKSKTFKFVLAAVYHGRISSHKPCGAYAYNTNLKNDFESLAVSQSISNEKIYKWIRTIMSTY